MMTTPGPPPSALPSWSALIEALLATSDRSANGSVGARLPGARAAVGIEVVDAGGDFDAAALRKHAADYRARPLLIRGDPALGRWADLVGDMRLVPSVDRSPAAAAAAEEEEEEGEDGWAPSKVYRITVDRAKLCQAIVDREEQQPGMREEDIQVGEWLGDRRKEVRALPQSPKHLP